MLYNAFAIMYMNVVDIILGISLYRLVRNVKMEKEGQTTAKRHIEAAHVSPSGTSNYNHASKTQPTPALRRRRFSVVEADIIAGHNLIDFLYIWNALATLSSLLAIISAISSFLLSSSSASNGPSSIIMEALSVVIQQFDLFILTLQFCSCGVLIEKVRGWVRVTSPAHYKLYKEQQRQQYIQHQKQHHHKKQNKEDHEEKDTVDSSFVDDDSSVGKHKQQLHGGGRSVSTRNVFQMRQLGGGKATNGKDRDLRPAAAASDVVTSNPTSFHFFKRNHGRKDSVDAGASVTPSEFLGGGCGGGGIASDGLPILSVTGSAFDGDAEGEIDAQRRLVKGVGKLAEESGLRDGALGRSYEGLTVTGSNAGGGGGGTSPHSSRSAIAGPLLFNSSRNLLLSNPAASPPTQRKRSF